MNMACCSVLRGGGTNQELVLHCFHESGGDFIVSLVTHIPSLKFGSRVLKTSCITLLIFSLQLRTCKVGLVRNYC